MSLVKTIRTDDEFRTVLRAAPPTQLVVVDWTAQWCQPCQIVKPLYAAMSTKYRHVLFAQVDVDQLQQTAASNGVTSMPTFHLFKAGVKISELVGARVAELETLIKTHQGPTGEDGGSGSSSTVNGHSDLLDFVDLKQLECLNQDDGHVVRSIFKAKPDASFLQSDVDEQLIINIQFNQAVRLHSIKIIGPADKAPKTVKTYVNRPQTLSFDEADSVAETELLEFAPADYVNNAALKNLRFVKYQSVHSLQLFVADNIGGDDVTIINQLTLYGTPVETTKMNDLKPVTHGGEASK